MDIHGIIEKQKDDINSRYKNYTNSLELFLSEQCEFDAVNSSGNDFFGCLEHYSAHNRTLEGFDNSRWNQWLAETCIDVLYLILTHYKIYRNVDGDNSLRPSSTAFAAMQRIVEEHDKKAAKEIRKLFFEESLPVYGFDNKGKMKLSKIHERILSITLGIISLICFALLIIFMDEPKPLKYNLISLLVSLLAGISAALLTGNLYLKVGDKLNAKSGGAVFVFSMLILNGIKFI
ncbi:hypothetical protein [Pectobacterium versatile]|uniref:hypothetical protein n=1 Tax=Pectobacterium versatile TaxID=2488639 RepID=UPI001F3CF317|nr:hypothetical protein [Pectobacterium versatile]